MNRVPLNFLHPSSRGPRRSRLLDWAETHAIEIMIRCRLGDPAASRLVELFDKAVRDPSAARLIYLLACLDEYRQSLLN